MDDGVKVSKTHHIHDILKSGMFRLMKFLVNYEVLVRKNKH